MAIPQINAFHQGILRSTVNPGLKASQSGLQPTKRLRSPAPEMIAPPAAIPLPTAVPPRRHRAGALWANGHLETGSRCGVRRRQAGCRLGPCHRLVMWNWRE